MREILGTPDKGIPRNLLDKSACVLLFPSVKKAAFIVGDPLAASSAAGTLKK
jgi:SH3 domain-containing YSC84-like protein 1